MKPSNISHVIADISYRDNMESLFKLKVLVGDKYEDEISKQGKSLKHEDLSLSSNVFYVRSIDELRSLMKINPRYGFIIRSYLVYSFHTNPSKDAYISSFGGSKVSPPQVMNFLINTILRTNDKELLSNLIKEASGYENNYDVKTNNYMLSDDIHTHTRKGRIKDDQIIKSVFLKGRESSLPNQDVIAIMRDQNKIPAGMVVREEFIALQPSQLVSLVYQLIGT